MKYMVLIAGLVNQVLLEETKEADKTTGQATHRVSRGIHDKVCIGNGL